MSGGLVVARVRRDEGSIVVLGTNDSGEACRAAGIHPSTHQWSGSRFFTAGWVLHRDGTASRLHPHEGPNARGRAGVLFAGPVRERPAEPAATVAPDGRPQGRSLRLCHMRFEHAAHLWDSQDRVRLGNWCPGRDSDAAPAHSTSADPATRTRPEQHPSIAAAAVTICEPSHERTWTVRDTGRQFCELCLRKAQALASAGLLVG